MYLPSILILHGCKYTSLGFQNRPAGVCSLSSWRVYGQGLFPTILLHSHHPWWSRTRYKHREVRGRLRQEQVVESKPPSHIHVLRSTWASCPARRSSYRGVQQRRILRFFTSRLRMTTSTLIHSSTSPRKNQSCLLLCRHSTITRSNCQLLNRLCWWRYHSFKRTFF